MAMVIRPFQTYIPDGQYTKENYAKILEGIGLIDVVYVKENSRTESFVYNFKFPDGTQVTEAAVYKDYAYGFTIVYDLEAHIIVFLIQGYQTKYVAPGRDIYDYIGMCVLPTSSGDVIDVRSSADENNHSTCNVFNIPCYPNYSQEGNPSSCTLLPAYVGLPTGLFEIPNCYVALNATYITGTKFVDETGAKWVSLIGPLLYKVPTIE